MQTCSETTNVTAIHGDGNITVSAGSGSTVNITTCSHDVQEDDPSRRRTCTTHKPTQNCEQFYLQPEKAALLEVVPKPIGKPQRLSTKTLVTCCRYIDNLAQLSALGKVAECCSIITKLLKTKTDPDLQVSLRHAASLNAINKGNFKKANRLLREVEAFLPETTHEKEHRVRWYQQKSLIKLRQGNCDMGLVLTTEALPLLDDVAPGCITAWLLLNHAWFLTEIAAGQDDDDDRRFLMRKAQEAYQRTIEHAEREHPKQMLHSQSRVPQLAKIGLALLYLGCRESVDISRLGFSNVSLDDLLKAKNVIAVLDKGGTVCNVSEFLLMMTKTCLHYRLGSYQQAYDSAHQAKDFATNCSFAGYVDFAERTVQYLQNYI
ncbi:uncharacterized protein LOC144912391 [Branchiostoma floridae x Branchiostoma belcheri]